jgi:hypothetical protein
MLNSIAVLFYLGTVAACALAYRAAADRPRSDRRVWALLGLLFLLIAAGRVTGFEDHIRQVLRGALTADGVYAERRDVQAPVVAALIALLALGVWLAFARVSHMRHSPAGHALIWGQIAGIGLAGLIAIRIVSLHFVDKILFKGPLHLNWVLDIGATATVLAAALLYRAFARRGRSIAGAR